MLCYVKDPEAVVSCFQTLPSMNRKLLIIPAFDRCHLQLAYFFCLFGCFYHRVPLRNAIILHIQVVLLITILFIQICKSKTFFHYPPTFKESSISGLPELTGHRCSRYRLLGGLPCVPELLPSCTQLLQ